MSTDLEPRLHELFNKLADATTITHAAAPQASAPSRASHSWARPLTSVAAVLLVAVLVGVFATRSSNTTPQSSVGKVPAGVFPSDPTASGYASPFEVAVGFLADRLDVSERDGAVTADVHAAEMDGDRAVVQFTVRDADTSGGVPGVVLTERVGGGDNTGWVITAATMGLGTDLNDFSYRDGTVEGELVAAGGALPLDVQIIDPASGEVVGTDTFPLEPSADNGGVEPHAFDIDGLTADTVVIRVWSGLDTLEFESTAYLETVATADSVDGIYRAVGVIMGAALPAELTGTVSVLSELGDEDSVELVNNDEITLSLRRRADNTACVDFRMGSVELDDVPFPGCSILIDPSALGPDSAAMWHIDWQDNVVFGLVPDNVVEIRDANGDPVTLENNAWYDITERVAQPYQFRLDDGTTITDTYGTTRVQLN